MSCVPERTADTARHPVLISRRELGQRLAVKGYSFKAFARRIGLAPISLTRGYTIGCAPQTVTRILDGLRALGIDTEGIVLGTVEPRQ